LLLKEIYRIPDKDFEFVLDELTSLLEVKELINIPLRKLSLGERMKIELIAALLHKPDIIYLDEPTIGLDITAQKSIRQFLKNYSEKYKPIIILTSHYMQDIEELCPRIIVLNSGSIVFDGEISQLKKFQKFIALKFSSNDSINPKLITSNFGVLTKNSDGTYQLNCPKEKIQEATSFILNNIKIRDLSIQEEEIGVLIEELMKKS
jgi:ABC-2 type transport system ATP-binding protein